MFTKLLDDKILQNSFLTNETARNNFLLQKIGIFIWRSKLQRIPVCVELDKRGVDLDTILCPVFKTETETVEHALLLCSTAKDLWERVFKWWNVRSSQYSGLCDMFNGIIPGTNTNIRSKLWQAIEWVGGYMLWRNRNLKAFEKKELDRSDDIQ
ncbi:uncharacterized protein [Rutidosis leptorrhynchoides]|uniref:uncharacterized protein n=1 Tax=Rutidosis leptorrhynchoides TaxID=125765 RepID=UPI003A9944BE